jgi:hypothetical protein
MVPPVAAGSASACGFMLKYGSIFYIIDECLELCCSFDVLRYS